MHLSPKCQLLYIKNSSQEITGIKKGPKEARAKKIIEQNNRRVFASIPSGDFQRVYFCVFICLFVKVPNSPYLHHKSTLLKI
jgi:hypothetical protein